MKALLPSSLMAVLLLVTLAVPKSSVETLPEDVMYCRFAATYSETVRGEIITRGALELFGPTFIKRPVLIGHAWDDPFLCVGTIQHTEVKYDEDLELYYLEMLVEIRDDVAQDRIRKGLFHYLSIGFRKVSSICSIDGQERCTHIPGEEYTDYLTFEKETAYRLVTEILGMEVSFVNVPASRWSRVLEWSMMPLQAN